MSLGEYIGAGAGTTKLLLHLNGSSADSSGNNNNGTDTAITYSQANGKFGQGAGLVGTSYISIPTQTYFNLQSSFSIFTWIYQTSAGKATAYVEDLVRKDNNTTNNRSWEFTITGPMDTQGRLRFIYNIPSNLSVYSTSTVSLNAWHSVGVVSTAGTYTFYLDGVAIGSGSTNITPAYQGTAPLNIGTQENVQYIESMVGNQDEVIIDNVAWTPQQVAKYYAYAKGRFGII